MIEMFRAFVVGALWISLANSLYFTMEDVEVTIPGDKRRFPPRARPLMILHAIQDSESGTNTPLNYTLSPTALLSINAKDGALTFSKTFYENQNEAARGQAVSVKAFDHSGNVARTTVRLEVDSIEYSNCDFLTTELCYWKSAKYQLYENRGSTLLGSLSSGFPADICKTHSIRYELRNGTSHIQIEKSPTDSRQWNLRSKQPFERDIMRSAGPKQAVFGVGARIYFGVRCTVISPGQTVREIDKILYVSVLDENDNTPQPQFEDTAIDIYVEDDQAFKSKLKELNHLMFIDRDSMSVNNYTVKLLGDTLKLFKVNYTIYEDDREAEPQTAIHCRIFAAKNAQLPDPRYTVVLQINDTTLLPGFGDSTANVTLTFHTPASSYRPRRMPVPADMKNAPLLYQHEITIFKYAAPFARVAQPRAFLPRTPAPHKFLLKYDSSARNKGDSGAFNVTLKGGIVYVQNVDVLQKTVSPVTLEVQWEDPTKGIISDVFHVFITQESNSSTCKNLDSSHVNWNHCSMSSNYKTCTETCGLGTGGNSSTTNYKTGGYTKCVWRGDKKPGSNHIKLYSTCTPDIDTCPDGICDPLEELHFLICPQDCSEDLNWLATKNSATRRGIVSARGICTCDKHGKCTCDIPTSGGGKKKTTSTTLFTTDATTSSAVTLDERTLEPNATAHRAIDKLLEKGPCGTKCLIGIGAGSLFLLGIITTVVACWRANHSGKAGRRGDRKCVETVNSLSGIPSDYVDRGIGTVHSADTLLLNFDMNTSLLQTTAPKIMPVDPKWEFPREKLHIEQTLGEGEFGRVLRARALEIGGCPGYTTVAVKTLKEGAREPELADLMSEYQLLKEVSHPNVIRLLGASTLPGGPVYLIIEFAEHGSLRNYLRRSRHLESEGQSPCTAAMLGATENEPLDTPACVIKPRDLLSFAWQISKGMAYLSDMKLVHRDLAARNVLLATGMVCKISDFGLTRDVYEDDTYLKRTKGRVPVKWMAPESLADHIYNSKSDVWSFGIIVWELVTLGASPYPGIAVQNLFHLLRTGYRMERPDNCSPALYKIMRNCWMNEPNERPSFRSLTLTLETMLSDGVEYLDLNPRVVHNRTYFTGVPGALNTPDDNEENTNDLLEEKNNFTNPDTVLKCAEADKLQLLWKRPESPKPVNVRTYENEESAQEMSHYESPIKILRRVDSHNHSVDKPNAYIDMAGKPKSLSDLTSSRDDTIESISKITSL